MLAVIYLSMTFFVANMAEKEIKAAFYKHDSSDFSVQLINYQRHFFSATATSDVEIVVDSETTIKLNIISTIYHYPHQAVIENNIRLEDEVLSKRAETYFGTPNWLTSKEEIDIFSRLTGVLTLSSGQYNSEFETLSTEPLLFSYQIDLKEMEGHIQLDWAGISGTTDGTYIDLSALQFFSDIGKLANASDDDYQLSIEKIVMRQGSRHSILQGLTLKGHSKAGKTEKTIDTRNELLLESYQFNHQEKQTFNNSRIKFSLTGLYQPAFDLLNNGSDNHQEVESALVELIHNGAQLTLSQLNSQTPWGEVDGKFDITLAKGASLVDIMTNPYILFDYMSGDASLVLPTNLLTEPTLTEPLQMGLMTGFLLQKEETLNLETSFHQGELIVNGRVIPL